MNGKNLTYDERLKLEAYLQDKIPKRQIARRLGCCVQTVYNEIARGMITQLDSELREKKVYFADVGERVAREHSAYKGRFCKYAYNDAIMEELRALLIDRRYSPAACAACLNCGICAGTIYNYIRAGRVDGVSLAVLPCPRRTRHKRVKVPKSNPYKSGKVLITERPEIITNRAEIGHYEIDTVYSSQKRSSACLLVLTDRASRHEIIRKMPDRRASSTQAALEEIIKNYRILSLTSDNGAEFSGVDVGVPWYFCHAYHSWERGTNEAYNRFIRRWFPKNTDFSQVTDEEVARLEEWINNYPIKRKAPCCAGL